MKTAKSSFKSFAPPADPRYSEANKVFQVPPAAGEAAHTPTPWHADGPMIYNDNGQCVRIADCTRADGDRLSIKREEANAAFIVRACNSHAALVEACQGLLEVFASDMDCEDMATIINARAVLALAKGE